LYSQVPEKIRGSVPFGVVALIALGLALGTPVLAQTENSRGLHNTEQPIEIVADTLEVRQSENLAIFEGDVDAVQGDMVLRADTLTVHYRDNKENPDQPGISRIDAKGHVFVSSPAETAQGNTGVYDVDNSMIHLAGDVILTQGGNVIQGERLEMNLATGKSRVMSAAGANGSTERVRGLFVPENKKN
jgi:lipopolysaccharide export system protein LptA